MNKFKRNEFTLVNMILSFAFLFFFMCFFIWVLFDRSDFASAFPVTMYVFMALIYGTQVGFTYPIYKKAIELKRDETIKYIWWATALTPLLVGQWMNIYIYINSGIPAKKEKEALMLYWASKVDRLMEEKIVAKLSKEQAEEVKTLLTFKQNKVLKKYEANYYISTILVNSGVLKNREVNREDLTIIASNII